MSGTRPAIGRTALGAAYLATCPPHTLHLNTHQQTIETKDEKKSKKSSVASCDALNNSSLPSINIGHLQSALDLVTWGQGSLSPCFL